MSFWNNQEPWGLPKGSLRALFMTILLGTVCYIMVHMVDDPEKYTNIDKGLFFMLMTWAMAQLAQYFNNRNGGT